MPLNLPNLSDENLAAHIFYFFILYDQTNFISIKILKLSQFNSNYNFPKIKQRSPRIIQELPIFIYWYIYKNISLYIYKNIYLHIYLFMHFSIKLFITSSCPLDTLIPSTLFALEALPFSNSSSCFSSREPPTE